MYLKFGILKKQVWGQSQVSIYINITEIIILKTNVQRRNSKFKKKKWVNESMQYTINWISST